MEHYFGKSCIMYGLIGFQQSMMQSDAEAFTVKSFTEAPLVLMAVLLFVIGTILKVYIELVLPIVFDNCDQLKVKCT